MSLLYAKKSRSLQQSVLIKGFKLSWTQSLSLYVAVLNSVSVSLCRCLELSLCLSMSLSWTQSLSLYVAVLNSVSVSLCPGVKLVVRTYQLWQLPGQGGWHWTKPEVVCCLRQFLATFLVSPPFICLWDRLLSMLRKTTQMSFLLLREEISVVTARRTSANAKQTLMHSTHSHKTH